MSGRPQIGEQVTVTLTLDQLDAIRRIVAGRREAGQPATVSMVVRELVELGLDMHYM